MLSRTSVYLADVNVVVDAPGIGVELDRRLERRPDLGKGTSGSIAGATSHGALSATGNTFSRAILSSCSARTRRAHARTTVLFRSIGRVSSQPDSGGHGRQHGEALAQPSRRVPRTTSRGALPRETAGTRRGRECWRRRRRSPRSCPCGDVAAAPDRHRGGARLAARREGARAPRRLLRADRRHHRARRHPRSTRAPGARDDARRGDGDRGRRHPRPRHRHRGVATRADRRTRLGRSRGPRPGPHALDRGCGIGRASGDGLAADPRASPRRASSTRWLAGSWRSSSASCSFPSIP